MAPTLEARSEMQQLQRKMDAMGEDDPDDRRAVASTLLSASKPTLMGIPSVQSISRPLTVGEQSLLEEGEVPDE